MSYDIIVEPAAQRDIEERFDYFAERNLEAAQRFVRASGAGITKLAEMPGMGSSGKFDNPLLSDVRQWPVPGFPNYLIFYAVNDSTITSYGFFMARKTSSASWKRRVRVRKSQKNSGRLLFLRLPR